MDDVAAPATEQLSVEQAQCQLDHIRSGKDQAFTTAYTNSTESGHAAAVERLHNLHRIASGEGAEQRVSSSPSQAAELTPEAARSKIDTLRKDPGFIERFQAGDTDARTQMEELHKKGYPDEGAGQEGDGDTPTNLPFAFGDEKSVDEMRAMNEVGHEIIEKLGVERELADGAIKLFDRVHETRRVNGEIQPMSETEHAKLEQALKTKFGDDFDRRMDKFEALLPSLGPAGGEWLQWAINSLDPNTAAWAIETLTADRTKQ